MTIRTNLGTHQLSIFGQVKRNERIRIRPTDVVFGNDNDPIMISVLYPKTKPIRSIATDTGESLALSMQASHDDTMNQSIVDVSTSRKTTKLPKLIINDFATNRIDVPV
jgi:hypothetical protein